MRKILFAFSFLMLLKSTNAQQLHFMSQYLQHNSMYNPAAAGMVQRDFLGVSYRSMWGSFPGNPKTSVVYGDFDLKKLNAGAAAYLYKDETGPTSRTGVQLAYSYHIKARNEKSRFGIGIELRGMQYAIDKAALTESLTSNDPLLMGASNKFVFDAGTGVYWTNGKLTAGFAATQLMGSKLKLADVTGSTLDGKLYRHYNLALNYKVQTGDDIYLIPSLMYRAIQNAPSECDLGMKVDYQDKLWWTLNWRINQFWSVQSGLKLLQRVRATYSYDYYVTPVSIFTNGSGSHEVALQFDLKRK